MAIVQLVVLTCLLATPEKCGEQVVPGSETDDIVTCLKSAGDNADAWQRKNSQYFVIGWRCEKKGEGPGVKPGTSGDGKSSEGGGDKAPAPEDKSPSAETKPSEPDSKPSDSGSNVPPATEDKSPDQSTDTK